MTALSDAVLIVEDEMLIALALQSQVEDMGLAVCGIAATADDAIALALKHRPGVVLMDVRLRGDADGVDASMAIYGALKSKVIFVTGSREPATLERINSDHPYATLFKPVAEDQLAETIRAARAG
jgi:two-component system, response regulator PdtaR